MNKPKDSKRVEDVHSRLQDPEFVTEIANNGMKPLISPIGVGGKYGFLSLNEGYITGWESTDNGQILVRIEIPKTPHKLAEGKIADLIVALRLDHGESNIITMQGQLLNLVDEEDLNERILKFVLQFNNVDDEKYVRACLKSQSYSEEAMDQLRRDVPIVPKPVRQVMENILIAIVVSGVAGLVLNPDKPAEAYCYKVQSGDLEVRKKRPESVKNLMGTDKPEDIANICRTKFGILIPVSEVEEVINSNREQGKKQKAILNP